MSSIFAPVADRDVEAGEGIRPRLQPLEPALQRRAQASQRFIVGVVVLLFIAGVVPFSSLLLLLVVFFLFAGCIQYTAHAQSNTQHPISGVGANLPAWQNAQRIQRAAVLSMLGTFGLGNSDLRNIITDPAAGGSFHNLRLSMMNRDFTDADYELPLQLDQAEANPVPQEVEQQIALLPSFKYNGSKAQKAVVLTQNADADDTSNNNMLCSVCLEAFKDQDQLTLLQCTHKFHTGCIQPWLRQSGRRSQCPLCKIDVF